MVRTPKELNSLADYLRGAGDVFRSNNSTSSDELGVKLLEAADYLERAASKTCGAGYLGCTGGPDCTSDHK